MWREVQRRRNCLFWSQFFNYWILISDIHILVALLSENLLSSGSHSGCTTKWNLTNKWVTMPNAAWTTNDPNSRCLACRAGTGPNFGGLRAVSGILHQAHACAEWLKKKAWAYGLLKFLELYSSLVLRAESRMTLCQDLRLGNIRYWAYLMRLFFRPRPLCLGRVPFPTLPK